MPCGLSVLVRGVLAVTVAALLAPERAAAQAPATVRTSGMAIVMETPRGDSLVIGTIAAGTVLEVFDRRGRWYLIASPTPSPDDWQRGWIHERYVEAPTGRPARVGTAPPARERIAFRGFVHAGGVRFTATDSFDAMIGTSLGATYGGGGGVVFPGGGFVQVDIERFRKTGQRALAFGDRVFHLTTPQTLTITPIQVTLGYRDPRAVRLVPYIGAGAGWHRFEEDSPSSPGERVSRRHAGYHVLGGAEVAVTRWLGVAGEIQWAAVPKGLGQGGVSAVFGEDDLGGATVRVKLVVGY